MSNNLRDSITPLRNSKKETQRTWRHSQWYWMMFTWQWHTKWFVSVHQSFGFFNLMIYFAAPSTISLLLSWWWYDLSLPAYASKTFDVFIHIFAETHFVLALCTSIALLFVKDCMGSGALVTQTTNTQLHSWPSLCFLFRTDRHLVTRKQAKKLWLTGLCPWERHLHDHAHLPKRVLILVGGTITSTYPWFWFCFTPLQEKSRNFLTMRICPKAIHPSSVQSLRR